MRTISISILLSMTLLAQLVSCSSGTNNWDPDSTSSVTSNTYMSAEDEIEKMKHADWESSVIYDNIITHYIRNPKSISETQRISLQRSLNQAYAEQLVRTVGNILKSPCANRHSTLNSAVAEYKKHTSDFGQYKPEQLEMTMSAYEKHQKMLQFGVSTSYNVPLSSYLDPYNGSYDSQKRNEAAAIRAQKPTCSAIKQKVSEESVNNALAKRKQNYYAALVSKFCRDPKPSRSGYNRLLQIVGSAQNPSALTARVNAHWESAGSDNIDF